MHDFPAFMKNPINRIASSSQHTPGVEGYVYDGADGSQMAFWTCRGTAKSAEHVHDYDEYMIVVEGCLLIPMKVGTDSGLIPGSDSDVIPGVFGAKRRWPSYRA